MSKAYPIITIGITAYNAQDTIERAVASALGQTYPLDKLDIIIVDDASTDQTVEKIKSLTSQHKKNIRFFVQPQNSGVAAARNLIIEKAQGMYLAFFDDDDVSLPERIMTQYEVLSQYCDINGVEDALCFSARRQYYPSGKECVAPTICYEGVEEGLKAPHGEMVARNILTGEPMRMHKNKGGARTLVRSGAMATCSQMGTVALYRRVEGFDTTFRRSEDTEFNVRAALAGAHFIGTDRPLVNQTMTMASDKKIDIEKRCALQLLEKYQDFIASYTSYEFAHQWWSMKYDLLAGERRAFFKQSVKLFLCQPWLCMKRFFRSIHNIGVNFTAFAFVRKGK